MTILTFPANPSVGTLYVAPNGYVYRFDGVKWNIAATDLDGSMLYLNTLTNTGTTVTTTGTNTGTTCTTTGTNTGTTGTTTGTVIPPGNASSISTSTAIRMERYTFTDSLRWVVNHNKNTTRLIESIADSNGNRFFAKIQIIDSNNFVVYLTEAKSGTVDVIFG